jgi:opacity protein-like surface antigen
MNISASFTQNLHATTPIFVLIFSPNQINTMKAFYFLFVFFLFTTALTAQYEKGSWYLDGNSSALLSLPLGDDFRSTEFSAQAFRAGYFFTDRLLVGSQISVSASAGNDSRDGYFGLELRPFARYYFPGGKKRKVSYFGEVGFGAIAPSSSNFSAEADFHFGGGAEIQLFPGVVGTAMLRYDGNSRPLNTTSLSFGTNLLLGQLEKFEGEAPLRAGTFSTTGSLGGLSLSVQGSDRESNRSGGGYLAPNIGYFLADGLMAEGKLSITYFGLRVPLSTNQTPPEARSTNILNTSLEFNLRYYLKKSGFLLPYVTGGAGYQAYRTKTTDDTSRERVDEIDTFFYQAGAGASWFLSPNIALNGSILYRSVNYDGNNFTAVIEQDAVRSEVGLRFFLKR